MCIRDSPASRTDRAPATTPSSRAPSPAATKASAPATSQTSSSDKSSTRATTARSSESGTDPDKGLCRGGPRVTPVGPVRIADLAGRPDICRCSTAATPALDLNGPRGLQPPRTGQPGVSARVGRQPLSRLATLNSPVLSDNCLLYTSP